MVESFSEYAEPIDKNVLAADLRNSRQRHASVHELHQRTLNDLDVARAKCQALQVQAGLLHTECAATQQEIEEKQRRLLRVQLRTFPTELLRMVFVEAAVSLDSLRAADIVHFWDVWPSLDEDYSELRMSLPFRLSSVCQRWRRVCISTPSMWSYIGTCPKLNVKADVRTSSWLLGIRFILQRSASSPLDLCILSPPEHKDEVKDDTSYAWLRKILWEVSKHTHRWRHVVICLPYNVTETDIQFLRHPMPLLEYLDVSDHAPPRCVLYSRPPFPTFLPHCPKIRSLSMMTTFILPGQPLQSLQSLHLFVDGDSYPYLFDTLNKLPCLQLLSINLISYSPSPAPTQLTLPSLHTLGISGILHPFSHWAQCVQVPNIKTLNLGLTSKEDPSVLLSFIADRCASVITLNVRPVRTLGIRLRSSFSLLLDALCNVQELSFCSLTLDNPQLFHALDGDAQFLPKLSTLTLRRVEITPAAGDALCDFVNRRKDHLRLYFVASRLRSARMPDWMQLQLGKALGDRFALGTQEFADEDDISSDDESVDGTLG